MYITYLGQPSKADRGAININMRVITVHTNYNQDTSDHTPKVFFKLKYTISHLIMYLFILYSFMSIL